MIAAWHMCERNGNVTGSSASGRRSSLASTTLNNQPVTQLTYDQIGNRITCNNTHYRPNACNQYEDLSYDSDGNMTMYDGWALTWNGENRLIRMIKGTAKLEFAYDYMGRRYEKKVYANDVLTKHQRFIYDGYKLIEIRNALNNNALTHSFVWRKVPQDVPYSMKYGNTTYYYVTDANKNVVCLLSGYSSAADYQYGPWGEIREIDGTAAYWNPFRFSSEFYDDETGLVYYNYRYYSPALGRWLSRDPIGEDWGANLYIMCQNNVIMTNDYLGQYTIESAAYVKYRENNKLTPVIFSDLNSFDLWFYSLTKQEKFNIWYEIESRYKGWTDALPKCPRCLPKRNGKFQSPDSNIWESPHSVYNALKYHPGATWEIRTKHAATNGAGNQCTYDEHGIIITSKYGCGTADRVQATRNLPLILFNITIDDGHIGHDVTPFDYAYYIDGNKHGYNVDKYIHVRPFIGGE